MDATLKELILNCLMEQFISDTLSEDRELLDAMFKRVENKYGEYLEE
jgi:hypothetical protein